MTALHLAGPETAPRLLTMIAAFHEELGLDTHEEMRANALAPLLEGSPHGAAYIIGPERAPIGYVIVCFGWSIELGGLDGFIDEIWIRPGVRGRGIASEVLGTLPKALADAGLKALHLEVRRDDERVISVYKRSKFKDRSEYMLMTRRF